MEYIDWPGVGQFFALGSFAGFGLGCILGLLAVGTASIVRLFEDL